MKILLVGTCLGIGGAEKVIVDLADSYQHRGHETRIVALRGDALLRPKSNAVQVHTLRAEHFWQVFAAARKLARLIAAFKPDVVHAHLFHAIVITRLIRLFVPVPVLVTTAHSTRVGGTFRSWAYRATARLSDVSSVVSREAAEEFVRRRAAAPEAMRVVYNGISHQDFWREADARKGVLKEFGFPKESRIIVAVGRLSEPKDYPNLLRAVSQLDAAREGLYVIVAGEGMLRQALAGLAAELGITDRVRFVGVRSDVRRLLSASDVFVLSSAWEGFPMVVGEAMACECTVVATDCGGVKEFLGSTGILVPPRDSVALAAGIQRALSLSTGERRDMGFAARARVSELFSLNASAERWLRIYEDGLGVSRC